VRHINEQWPSYWARLFNAHDFVPVDALRPAIWADERVAFWYRQNTILYARDSRVGSLRGLARQPGITDQLDLVHPALYLRQHTAAAPSPPLPSLTRLLRLLPRATSAAFRRRVLRGRRPPVRRARP